MNSFLLLLVGALVGVAATFFLACGVTTGLGAGAGIVTGLQAGVCATAEAAKSSGYITADQVDELLAAAGRVLAGAPGADAPALNAGDANCQELLTSFKQAANKE